jgi:rare lipoprotein A
MPKLKNIIALLALTLAITSCAGMDFFGKKAKSQGHYKVGEPYTIAGQTYVPKEQPDYDEVGLASWYGSDFHGKKTANGDTFDKDSLTAAHNTLPLPSMVRVTNLENNKTLIVMVNDRGPFSKKRVIDVSERSAQILGFKDKGVAKVRVQFLQGQTKRLLADMPNAPKYLASANDAVAEPASFDTKVSSAPLPAVTAAGEEAVASNITVAPSNAKTALQKGSKTAAKNAKNQVTESDTTPKNMVSEEITKDEALGKAATTKVPETAMNKALAAEDAAAPTATPVASTVSAKSDEEKTEAAPSEKGEKQFIQAGTFSVKANAERAEKKLRALGDVSVTTLKSGSKNLYRVRVGPIENPEIAKTVLQKVIKLGHADARIVSE